MAIPPVPRLVLIVERSTGSETIGAWQLPSDGAVDVTPGKVGIRDAVAWMNEWSAQEGPAVDMATPVPLFWGADKVQQTTDPRYLPFGYASNHDAPTEVLQYRMPRGGTLSGLRVRHNTPKGNGLPIVYTVRINGVATALSASLASTGTDAQDLTNSVAIATDDDIDIEVTKAADIGDSPEEITVTMLLDMP